MSRQLFWSQPTHRPQADTGLSITCQNASLDESLHRQQKKINMNAYLPQVRSQD